MRSSQRTGRLELDEEVDVARSIGVASGYRAKDRDPDRTMPMRERHDLVTVPVHDRAQGSARKVHPPA
jgi:hypothetical protein